MRGILLGVLAMARSMTEETFTEVVTVGVRTYAQGPNLETIETIAAPAYDGPARIKWESLTTTDRQVAGQTATEQTPVLKIPAGTAGVHEGMVVLVASSEADPTMPSRRFRVAGSPQGGQTTALRYPLAEESS